MLQVITQANYLLPDEKGKGYCFRSVNSETLTEEQIIAEMLDYNSTITDPDIRAVLSVYRTVVTRNAKKGYNVETIFVFLHTTANGTCENEDDAFQPGSGDNCIDAVMNLKSDVKKSIVEDAKYKVLEPGPTSNPFVRKLSVLDDKVMPKEGLDAKASDDIQLRGKNLSFDTTDDKQGVFLSLNGTETKVTKYTRLGTNIIIARIPSGVSAGKYKVILRTKPRKDTYVDGVATDELNVTA